MKKLLLMAMLATLAMGGAFAKEKKNKQKDQNIEVTVDEFFSSTFIAQTDKIYKIINVELLVDSRYNSPRLIVKSNLPEKIEIENTFYSILSPEEISRIEKAKQFDSLKKDYVIYAQSLSPQVKPRLLKIIKIENIPTEEQINKEEKLLKETRETMKAKTENDGGYNDMPWGTSVDDFLSVRPDAKKIEDDGVVERYVRKGSSGSEMTYKFYNGELVGGVTVYNLNGDDAETKGNDINQRMKELYGKWADVKETSEHKNVTINFLGSTHKIAYTEKHLKTTWNKSSSFKILLDVCALIGDTKNDTYNICMYITINLLTYTINYENPSMAKEIAEANVKLKKEQAEAKKLQEEEEKRRRMDNLDL